MSDIKFDDDTVYQDTPMFNSYGDIIGYKRQVIMTKEVFVECYKKWILEQGEQA